MSPPTGADSAPPPVQEWLDLVESALQGIHHSINNRVGSLLAVVELQRTGGMEGQDADALSSEVERLQECNRVVRLLPEAAGGEEALDLRDVLNDAIQIHQILPSIKELKVVVAVAVATAVRAERWALMRALTLLLKSAKSGAKAYGAAQVQASIESDDAWVRVRFRFEHAKPATEGSASGSAAPSRYAQWLAERAGGTTSATDGTVELRLPTLKARRAADRR